ncbi:hypothetical protein GCM10022251_29100 [Phytohabitans flavus]
MRLFLPQRQQTHPKARRAFKIRAALPIARATRPAGRTAGHAGCGRTARPHWTERPHRTGGLAGLEAASGRRRCRALRAGMAAGGWLCDAEGEAAGAAVRTTADIAVAQILWMTPMRA